MNHGLNAAGRNFERARVARLAASFALLAAAIGGARAQPLPPPSSPAPTPLRQPQVRITTSAAVERETQVDGRTQVRLVPADRVVAGDAVVYTLSVRNEGPDPANGVVVTSPIPRRMRYLAGTAVGPAVDVSFSVDGGRHYDAPDKLRVRAADGAPRPAGPADYTNIRWVLQDTLHAGSVAFLRYRAVLR